MSSVDLYDLAALLYRGESWVPKQNTGQEIQRTEFIAGYYVRIKSMKSQIVMESALMKLSLREKSINHVIQ